jgi:hypothetical protein
MLGRVRARPQRWRPEEGGAAAAIGVGVAEPRAGHWTRVRSSRAWSSGGGGKGGGHGG